MKFLLESMEPFYPFHQYLITQLGLLGDIFLLEVTA
jgi:hypothetical protein